MTRIYFTKLAYLQLLIEVKKYTYVETGAILVGRIVNGDFYVFESLDSGMNCRRSSAIFYRDNPYSEHLVDVVRAKYEKAVAIGFWHRHPGNFNRFSYDDLEANIDMARVLGRDIISGLINICENKVHTRFWHISLDNKYEEIEIIVDDEPFKEVLKLKSINDVESQIVYNELGFNVAPTSSATQPANLKYIESCDGEKEKKKGFIARWRKNHVQSEEEQSQRNVDIPSYILTIISPDLEKLSAKHNIFCQKYRNSNTDDTFKDKLFLHFTNAKNNNECDIVLYFQKQDLVFYVANKPIQFKNGVLAEYVYYYLGDDYGKGDI